MEHKRPPLPPEQEPARCAVVPENLPTALFDYPQWVGWRYVDRGARRKPDKQPVNPHTLGNAGVTWPNTWGTFEQALAAYQAHELSGIGFVLTPDDPFVGVDLDHCVDGQEITEAAQTVVEQLSSYTEVSPSGKGLRILVECPAYTSNTRRAEVEIYAHSRFLTLTGRYLPGTPSAILSVHLEHLVALTPPAEPHASPRENTLPPAVAPTDERTLWAQIFEHDHYGADHLRRFQGDLSLDGNDHSLAVLRLLNCLARWTDGDPVQMRALMLQSPLANDKWFSRRGKSDWLDYQIGDAIGYMRRRR